MSFPNTGTGIQFHDVVEILESDNTITTRLMNPDGGFYHTNVIEYDDDSMSFDLANHHDENGMTYLDAVEDDRQINDIDDGNNMFQSNR
jgi:hypothetical protein